MNLLNRKLRLFGLSALLTLSLSSLKADIGAGPFLEKAVGEVLTEIYPDAAPSPDKVDLTEKIKPLLAHYFDFDAITRRSIGPGWRQISDAQQAEITKLFTDLVVRTYTSRLNAQTDRPLVSLGEVKTLAAGRVEVGSSITYQGSLYSVAYRMEPSGSSWKIYDVVIEGVSLVGNYRGQFDALFRKGGADAIIETLKTKLAEPAGS